MESKRKCGSVWTTEEAVSPVIGTILMVAITVVLAGALVISLNPPGGGRPTVSIGTTTDIEANPSVGGDTANGGLWRLTIIRTSATVHLSRLEIVLVDPGGARLGSLKPMDNAVVATTGPAGAAANVYASDADGAGPNSPSYDGAPSVDANPFVASSLSGATGLTGVQLQSLQHAGLAFMDADSDGTVNSGDTVLVFRSNNGDAVSDVAAGSELRLMVQGNSALSQDLG